MSILSITFGKKVSHFREESELIPDGTIEFVSPDSEEKFKSEGSICLVWNQLGNAASFDA